MFPILLVNGLHARRSSHRHNINRMLLLWLVYKHGTAKFTFKIRGLPKLPMFVCQFTALLVGVAGDCYHY